MMRWCVSREQRSEEIKHAGIWREGEFSGKITTGPELQEEKQEINEAGEVIAVRTWPSGPVIRR